ncbi:MAG: alpha/beta fold hydrolase [Desulfobacterales bacterium]
MSSQNLFFKTDAFKKLYPFSSHFMPIRGLDYHYLDEGTGEPLVMVHGNPTWSFYFRSLVKGLSPQYRCLVPDHIGCGLSEKPDGNRYDFRAKSRVEDLEIFLDHLNIKENLTLILHDWGGMIGMAYAVNNPERIKRLVILNTAAFFLPKRKKLPIRLQVARNLRTFAERAILHLNLFAIAALYMASAKGLEKAVKKSLIAPYNTPGNRLAVLKFVQDIPLIPSDPSYSVVNHTQRNLYRLKDKPMLICWGMKDFVFDNDFLVEWRQRFPEAEVHRFPNAGHYILEDQPDSVLKYINEFLNDTYE